MKLAFPAVVILAAVLIAADRDPVSAIYEDAAKAEKEYRQKIVALDKRMRSVSDKRVLEIGRHWCSIPASKDRVPIGVAWKGRSVTVEPVGSGGSGAAMPPGLSAEDMRILADAAKSRVGRSLLFYIVGENGEEVAINRKTEITSDEPAVVYMIAKEVDRAVIVE